MIVKQARLRFCSLSYFNLQRWQKSSRTPLPAPSLFRLTKPQDLIQSKSSPWLTFLYIISFYHCWPRKSARQKSWASQCPVRGVYLEHHNQSRSMHSSLLMREWKTGQVSPLGGCCLFPLWCPHKIPDVSESKEFRHALLSAWEWPYQPPHPAPSGKPPKITER